MIEGSGTTLETNFPWGFPTKVNKASNSTLLGNALVLLSSNALLVKSKL